MYRIQTLDRISGVGLEKLPREKYEVASELPDPDAILVRSSSMHQLGFPSTLKAIGRAGVGVNNIPLERCTDEGIVVFNTPGANANSVKELVLAGLLISSRSIIASINWLKSMADRGDEVPTLYEKEKSRFAGPEIKGKNLGVIGLGAVGVMVANDAVALGMNVAGFDPFISVESAWGLSRRVKRVLGLEALISDSDYISIHTPLTDQTRGIINRDRMAMMRRGVRLLNFARGGLVNNEDLKEAISTGIVNAYVTDFPDAELLGINQVIAIPHLGASTPEAEDNCAAMAVSQICEFLEQGNIRNSVNFPLCEMPLSGKDRVVIANKNVPKMVSQIATVLASEKHNIADMLNKHRDEIAYNIIDLDGELRDETVVQIKRIEGVIMVRKITSG
jgi:D-3-phosphoglycerate dehydrogenase